MTGSLNTPGCSAAILVLALVRRLRHRCAGNQDARCAREMAPGPFRIFNAKGHKLENQRDRVSRARNGPRLP
jgi:hypothetical protein